MQKRFYLGSLFFSVICMLLATASSQVVAPNAFGGLKWRMIGPFRGGREIAVAGVPGNPSTFYFGSVDGGVWKTTDAGVVWKPIFDNQSVGSIGAIAVAPSDPNTIYVGTGEADIRSDLASGNGVYKSSDGGETWHNIGLHDSRQISRIVVDSKDANLVFVAALGHAYGPNDERGVYKSADGGSTWSRVLNLGPEIGIADLAVASGNPSLLFATAWHTRRPPWSVYAPIDGPGNGIYRSTDGGSSWSKLSGNGLRDGDSGRTAVAVSADGNRVYALIPGKDAGLYRSDDRGTQWSLINSDARLTSRAWYFGNITIDPSNMDVVYMPNVALYRSNDGGKTVSVLRGAPGGDDYHQIWIDPQDSSRMVLGTDQGTSVSLNRGETWSSWYNQPTAQFYHVITDNQFPYVVYGTQQDSGAAAVYSRTEHGQITPRDWFPSGGSESGYIAPDPDDPNIIYITGTYGDVARLNLRTAFSQDITPWPVPIWETEIAERKYRDPWTPVLVFSPLDHKALYLGTQYVMRTRDGGLHWDTISPDLTGAAATDTKTPLSIQNAKERGYGVVYTIAPSSVNRDLIWAGTDTGLIHITRNAGKSWSDVTPKGFEKWSKISLIEASHFDPAEAYAAVDRHRLDDQTPYIYRTRDYGATWRLVTKGISAPSFARAVREDPARRGLLYAATEFGVYVSFDDGDHWQSLQLNLPVTSVQDLVIHGDDLVIATHGRSFWILDDVSPLRQFDEALRNAAFLYRPATAIRMDNDGFMGTPLPPEEPIAENPPNGAVLDYWLPDAASQVLLEVFDSQHQLVRSFSAEDTRDSKHPPRAIAERWFPEAQRLDKNAGAHRFLWDLASGSSGGKSKDSDIGDYAAPHAPKVAPGVYEVRLTVDGKTYTQSLKVIKDPNSSASAKDLNEQYRLGREMFDETLRSRQAMAEIAAVQKQIGDLQKMASGHADVVAALSLASAEFRKVVDKQTSPGALGLEQADGALGSALAVVESGDRAIPSQALEVFRLAREQANKRIAEWDDLKKTRLPQLNEQLRQANLAPVAISEIEREVQYLMTR
jgi:photosystem II stability/assembly factor-like uncharacterized protein